MIFLKKKKIWLTWEINNATLAVASCLYVARFLFIVSTYEHKHLTNEEMGINEKKKVNQLTKIKAELQMGVPLPKTEICNQRR